MDEVLAPLATLIARLHQLDDLIHKYKCRLSLTQFLKVGMDIGIHSTWMGVC